MNARELLGRLRNDVNATAREGRGSISVVELDRYLAQWEPHAQDSPPDQLTLDRLRARFEEGLEAGRREHEWKLEEFRSANKAGREAMKASILVNGGASVALLAFLGTAKPHGILGFTSPLLLFVAGVLFATMAMGATYVGQAMSSLGRIPAFRAWNACSIAMTVVSYLAFGAGGVISFFAFRLPP